MRGRGSDPAAQGTRASALAASTRSSQAAARGAAQGAEDARKQADAIRENRNGNGGSR